MKKPPKPIVIFKPGTVSVEDAKALEDAGYIAIQCSEPESFAIVLPSAKIKGDEILQAALNALTDVTNSGANRQYFGEQIIKLLNK